MTGAAMFLLFILHHGLNWRWYPRLAKGRYTPLRVIQTIVNFLVLASMAGLMVSGIILSREVFAFLPISGGMGFARILHMLSAYWGFILMSTHLGLHWGDDHGDGEEAAGRQNPSEAVEMGVQSGRGCSQPLRHLRLYETSYRRLSVCAQSVVFFDMEQPCGSFSGNIWP